MGDFHVSTVPSYMSLVVRKQVFGVSDQVRLKPGCSTTEDGQGLEISDLRSRGIYYPSSENKGADQPCGYRQAGLHLRFHICKNPVFSWRGSYVHSTTCQLFPTSIYYCANGLNVSNLIGNCLVNFMYLVTNSFDKYLNRILNSIAFIER